MTQESQNCVSNRDIVFFLTDLKEKEPFYEELVRQGIDLIDSYVSSNCWEFYRIDEFSVTMMFLDIAMKDGYDFSEYELPEIDEYGVLVAKARNTETIHFPFWKNYPAMHRAVTERCKNLSLTEHFTPVDLSING